MLEVLKLLHVVGWAAWFGLAIAEASVGAQVRKATDAGGRTALGRVWVRVGRVLVITMIVAVVFGLATFAYELTTSPFGAQGFMQQRAYLYIHIMLGLGIVAAALAFLASQARGKAVAALEKGDSEGFTRFYKLAAMFSGIMSLCILGTIAEVYLRTL